MKLFFRQGRMVDFSEQDFVLLNNRVQRLYDDNLISAFSEAPIYLYLKHKLLLDRDEIRSSFTDGHNDCGIDAVYIDWRQEQPVINLFQSKMHESKRKAKAAFKYSELSKICRFLEIVVNRPDNFGSLVNERLKQKLLEIWDVQDKDFPTIKVWLVSNGMPCSESEIAPDIQKLAQYDVKVEQFHLSDLVDFCIKRHSRRLQHEFKARESGIVEHGDSELKSVVGYISAHELYHLLKDLRDERKLDYALFDLNVRGYLGAGTPINQEIHKSASSKNNRLFSALNNGITLIGSHVKVLKSVEPKKILVKNLSIVNGAQTCSAIFDSMKELYPNLERFSSLSVLFRLFETDNQEMIDRIAISTNTQNRIHPRDLKANDVYQTKLERELRDLNVQYIRKRGVRYEEGRSTLDAFKAGQLVLAYDKHKPAEAKKQSDNIFAEWYYEIFAKIDVKRLVRAFELYRVIESKQDYVAEEIRHKGRSRTEDTFITYGGFHILTVCSVLESNSHDLTDEMLVERAIRVIADVLNSEGDPAHYSFFRDSEITKKIVDRCTQFDLFD